MRMRCNWLRRSKPYHPLVHTLPRDPAQRSNCGSCRHLYTLILLPDSPGTSIRFRSHRCHRSHHRPLHFHHHIPPALLCVRSRRSRWNRGRTNLVRRQRSNNDYWVRWHTNCHIHPGPSYCHHHRLPRHPRCHRRMHHSLVP